MVRGGPSTGIGVDDEDVAAPADGLSVAREWQVRPTAQKSIAN
jgi:hypothetical protein